MTNEQHTYWISIGRNVGANPLSETEWGDFRADVRSTVEVYGRIECEVEGSSTYLGVPEDTYLILVEVDADTVQRLSRALPPIGYQYGQDAIGFVGGPGDGLITISDSF